MAVESIEEIIELQAITPVPEAEAWLEGTTLFRDRVVPVLNLARRFGLNGAGPTDDTRIIVVTGGMGSPASLSMRSLRSSTCREAASSR